MDLPNELRPYNFHGIDLKWREGRKQATATCPSCGSTKFYIDAGTGQYHCKRCDIRGNKYTFLKLHHQVYKDKFNDRQARKINKYRGGILTPEAIKESGLCLNGTTDLLLPVPTPDSKGYADLRKWSPKTRNFYSTPDCCSLYFFRWNSDNSTVFITEGEWDAISLSVLLKRAKHSEPCNIVAVPGAGTFKQSWIKYFENKDVILLYDNDHDKVRKGTKDTYNPGKDGMDKVCDFLADSAKSIKRINWSKYDNNLPDGFDIGDVLKRAVESKKSKLHLKGILSALDDCISSSPKKNREKVIKPLPRSKFEDVVKDWKSCYEFNQSFEDVLAVCFATLASLYLSDKRNPLWTFVVGPPSSGKTTIIEGFKAALDHTIYISELTPASLATGIRLGDDVEDPSLLNRGNNKVWFIEDFTPLLSTGGRDEVFGILRAAYNGYYTAHFAVHQRDYPDLHFGIVSGVTHAIEEINLGDLGERFLRIRLLDEDFNEDEHIMRALNNVGIRDDQKQVLLGGICGFIEHLLKNPTEPEWDDSINEKLVALAKFTALMRTKVSRGKNGIITQKPIPEVASRIATQLKKLGLALATVYNRDTITDNCYRVMQKVAYDSCVGWNLELVQLLSKNPDGLMIKTMAEEMSIHVNQVRKITEDALAVGLLEHSMESNGTGRRGRKGNHYKISERVTNLIERGELIFEGITEKPSRKTKRGKRNV